MNKITPFLWFQGNAEEAVDFYLSVFPDGRRLTELHSDAATAPPGKALVIDFEVAGQQFTALNGPQHATFNEAVSFVVRCDTQDEIDHYWAILTADGGAASRCGWLKDKFGLSWQVVPVALGDLIRDPRGMKAMMTMSKLDIAALERAVAAD